MEQNIRNQVFETNSSTTHSLTILSEDEFNEFEKGGLYLNWNDELVTRDEIKAEIDDWDSYVKDFIEDNGFDSKEDYLDNYNYTEEQLENDVINYYVKENGYKDYDHILGDDAEYESYEEHYTTKSGDKIVVFGYYGYEH